MEFFNKANVVKLRSHLDKYLLANEDEETVRQSRNGTREARWTVEFIEGKSHVILLKSCHGSYLTASDEPFLLGMTGKKVVQTFPGKRMDNSVEWEPIKEGELVKLRSKGGRFLRANGATPPWRNSITYDVPFRTATQDWVLWEVEVVDISLTDDSESLPSYLSSNSSFCSLPDDFIDSNSRWRLISSDISKHSRAAQDGMKYFEKAKAVRLQSHHGKYLVADDDEKTVRQSRNGSSHKARWTVEFVKAKSNAIRLKSCHGLYLTATADPFLLGMTGKKVIQSSLSSTKMENATEWEPIKESGYQIKLRTTEGKFLRANGGTPPWRNSITHDVPHRTATQDWVLWGVDVVDINLSVLASMPSHLSSVSSFAFSDDDFMGSPDTGSPAVVSGKCDHVFKRQLNEEGSPAKSEGRSIYYHVADDNGNVDDGVEAASFNFKGNGLEELTDKLEEETGLENIIVCSRNRVNGKLYPLRLALPPNNATMHIVVVPSTSKAARDFVPGSPTSSP
ncbi:hypothetical protein LguiA_017138 [Lonicera macranthoides]